MKACSAMREGGYEGPVVEDMNAEVGWKEESCDFKRVVLWVIK